MEWNGKGDTSTHIEGIRVTVGVCRYVKDYVQ